MGCRNDLSLRSSAKALLAQLMRVARVAFSQMDTALAAGFQ